MTATYIFDAVLIAAIAYAAGHTLWDWYRDRRTIRRRLRQ